MLLFVKGNFISIPTYVFMRMYCYVCRGWEFKSVKGNGMGRKRGATESFEGGGNWGTGSAPPPGINAFPRDRERYVT